MRAYVNLTEGTVNSEFPLKPVEYSQRVKGLSGERVELQFMEDGSPQLLPVGTDLRLSLRDRPGGTLLAELTEFTAPASAAGFYTGRLSLNTAAILAMLSAAPSTTAFAVVGELAWKIPDAADWEISDTMAFSLLRAVGANGGDPLALASPFDWLVGTLVAGSNVTLTVDSGTQKITIAAAGGGGGGNFNLDRMSDDGAFMIVKNALGEDFCKVPTYDLAI